MYSLSFPVCALLIATLITVVFFSKKRVKTSETRIFAFLVITTLIEAITTCILIVISKTFNIVPVLYVLIRINYIAILLWIWSIFLYAFYLSTSKGTFLKTFAITSIINIVTLIAVWFLELDIVLNNQLVQTQGSAKALIYVIGIFYFLVISYFIIKNIRNIKGNTSILKDKKYMPLYALILLNLIVLLIRLQTPEIYIESMAFSGVVLIMFFTIENPDLRVLNEMNLAKDMASKANNAKSDFLSSMSHEIRTPLNAIVGLSECIEEASSLEEAKENARDIVIASKTLLDIVNGVLDISKAESGEIELVNIYYNPFDLFVEVTRLIRNKLQEKKLELKVNLSDEIPPSLYGDRENIKKIITNILTNALKYTDKGYVDLKVSCLKTDDICRLVIAITDTGRGIKEENIDKLFTKFNRLDEDKNTTTEGTGLGLAITKKLVDLMDGKIVVQSVYGQGSRFTVAIDQKIDSSKENYKKEIITEEVNKKIQPPAEKVIKKEINTSSIIYKADYSTKKVLLIDDNKLNLKIAAKVLKEYNIQISEGYSGPECLSILSKGDKFDLLICDDMMPVMSGTKVMQELKSLGNPIPIVVLTANVMAGQKENYLKLGFDDYLGKPINREELDRVLDKFLN